MSANLLIFSAIAALAVMGALGVVFFKNAVHSALSLVGTFALLAILYLTLQANLLAWTQILVYAGAIMVLFLFVVMVLNLSKQASLDSQKDIKRVIGPALGAAFVGLIGSQVLTPLVSASDATFAPKGYGQPQAIGMALFTDYGYPFEAVSVLLLVGIVGSILLAKRRLR